MATMTDPTRKSSATNGRRKTTKKSAAKKTSAKKTSAKNTSGKKANAKKSSAKKSSAKKTGKKKASAKRTGAKKTAAPRRKYSPGASAAVGEEMRELEGGTARSGRSGTKVTSRKQAIAIGLSKARRSGEKVPPSPTRRKKS